MIPLPARVFVISIPSRISSLAARDMFSVDWAVLMTRSVPVMASPRVM